jgi:hypothetical protein
MHVLSSLYYVNVPFRAAKMKLIDAQVSETKIFRGINLLWEASNNPR